MYWPTLSRSCWSLCWSIGSSICDPFQSKKHPSVKCLTKVDIDTCSVSKFRFCHINSRSCKNKTHLIKDAIEDMDIDILCISETWLRQKGDESVIADLKPPGYELENGARTHRDGGGLAFIYREKISKSDIIVSSLPALPVSYELLCTEIKINSVHTLLIAVYYPGYSKKHRYTRSAFLNEFRELVITIRDTNKPFIICGDMNIHLDVESDPDTRTFNSIMYEHDLKQLVTTSTQQSGHILDIVIIPNSFHTRQFLSWISVFLTIT